MSVPSDVPFSKNSTCVMVAPELAVAVAVRLVAMPVKALEPAAGAVNETVGTDPTAVTVTAVESVVLPLSSTASARREKALAVAGVQVTE